MNINLKRKKFYPVSEGFNSYLGTYGRTMDFPELYEDLHRFSQLYPLFDRDGNDTLWKTVYYEPAIRAELNTKLTKIYSALRTNAPKTQDHLVMERVDFCDFGNSRPFRIRIVNQYNDNYDHFYVKIADASRLYGLELEHVLSPNRINYLVNGNTLIEEHIAGVPGDTFISEYFERPETNQVRIAKEFVKFNERSFVRLLGDMRSYNYVVDITPDFEDAQYRVRAIDFDQQSYEGNKEMYLPQTFLENEAVVHLCTTKLNYETMRQYQDEERTLIERRCTLARTRLAALWDAMLPEDLAPFEHVEILRDGLNQYHQTEVFSPCETMGQLVKLNLETSLAKQSG
ncbi:hypothetical protein VSU19_00380 [Verrucomicrobiales bacterium BCK34]|nr:hypothetical protein [Verrucomicrobiales bacterium BCK34]